MKPQGRVISLQIGAWCGLAVRSVSRGLSGALLGGLLAGCQTLAPLTAPGLGEGVTAEDSNDLPSLRPSLSYRESDPLPLPAAEPAQEAVLAPGTVVALDITQYDSCVIRRTSVAGHLSLLISSGDRPEVVMGVALPNLALDEAAIIRFIASAEYEPYALYPNHTQIPRLIAALLRSGRLTCSIQAPAL